MTIEFATTIQISFHKFTLTLFLQVLKFFSFKGVRARKIPRFSFSIKERGVLGEYVEAAVTGNIQFYVSITIHHSRSTFQNVYLL